MKANNCAIVLLYKGNVANTQVLQELKDVLVGNGTTIPELLNITIMDEKGVAEALLNRASIIEVADEEISSQEAIDNAITYIGERYKEYLGTPHLTMFAIRLAQDVNTARMSSIDSDSDPLLKAVEIISTETGHVKKNLSSQYKFTPSVVNIIKRVYNPY